MRMSFAARFRKAKEFVIQGWVQNTVQDFEFINGHRTMRVCAIGAMLAADGNIPESSRLDEELGGLFARANCIGNVGDIAAWNDYGLRTQKEVVAAFEKAAIEAEKLEAEVAELMSA